MEHFPDMGVDVMVEEARVCGAGQPLHPGPLAR